MNLTIVEDRTEVAERINSLHAEMTGHMSMAVKKAIQIGELLVEQKNSLEHGEWIPWVESNLTFGRKQAAAYMRVYNRRDEIANVTSGLHLTSLNQAVSLLADPKPEEVGVEQVVEYRDSDETIARLKKQEDTIQQLESDLETYINERRRLMEEVEGLRGASDQTLTEIQSVDLESADEIERLKKELTEANEELQRLESVKANEEHIKETLKEIQELKQKKSEMYADVKAAGGNIQIYQKTSDRSVEREMRDMRRGWSASGDRPHSPD